MFLHDDDISSLVVSSFAAQWWNDKVSVNILIRFLYWALD